MKSNIEWKFWGENDPLYDVAAWQGREKGGCNPWNNEDFYLLGQQDWRDFSARWERYGLTPGSCVEIGCGAGRITAFLSHYFEHVDAVDVSEAMIRHAERYIKSPNVEFHLADGCSLPIRDDTIDAVFSTHVFQHFDSTDDVATYLLEIARVLKADGSLMIHIPLYTWPAGTPALSVMLYRLKKFAEKMKANIIRQRIQKGKTSNLMRLSFYETNWLDEKLSQLGFKEIEFLTFVTSSNNFLHPFVLAKKA
ncbi:class I SAM-dependent methyltransferase [Pseudomonadota bacterium]